MKDVFQGAAQASSRKQEAGGQAARPWLRRPWDASPALVVTGLAHAGLLGLFAAGGLVDPRWVMGEPVWVKPAKFAASISLYTLTLAWMLTYVEGRRALVRGVGGVTAATLVLESLIIGLQAARGVRSHFNVSTPLDGALFAVTGVAILVTLGAGVVAAWMLFRQRLEDGALAWSLRLGLVLSLLGAGMGGMMTRPTEAQVEHLRQGQPSEAGAHSVGVPDGGPGLPAVGWSTQGGDLRVPHFLGLHAMQVLPLLGLWLSRGRLGRRLREAQRVGLVGTAAFAYAGVVAVLTWQALRGEPFLAPGAATLAALGALAAASLLGVGLALLRGRREAGLSVSQVAHR